MFTPTIGRARRATALAIIEGCSGRPVVVEPHAVDHGPVGHQSEESRLRIARFGERGDRADLDMTEAELTEPADRGALLVEARRDAEGRVEGQAEGCDRGSADGRVNRRTSAPTPSAGRARITA